MPSAGLVRVPDSVSLLDASTLAVTGLGSYWAVATRAKVKEGSRVFINGGTTACGLVGIQVAKALGAYVVATGNPASTELLTSLGADEVIDYRAVGDLSAQLAQTYAGKPFDLVYDTQGVEGLFARSPAYLRPEGPFLDIAGRANQTGFRHVLAMVWSVTMRSSLPVIFGGVPKTYEFFHVPAAERRQALESVVGLVATGEVKAVVDSSYKFEDAREAYARFASGRCVGKVVVHVE